MKASALLIPFLAIVSLLVSCTQAQDLYSSTQEQTENLQQVANIEPLILYESTLWKKDSYSVMGMWRIKDRGDQQVVLVFASDFQTKPGPDLKLVLSPEPIGQVSRKNVLRRSRVLALLRSNKGKQEYAIPLDIDLSEFHTLAIHCKKKTKLWSAAALVLD